MVYSNNFGQSRVGVRNRVVNVVNSVDADAIAFIAAAGITNLTQAAAINTLVNDLKTYGLWTKMKALYPMVGGTATSHKFNLKDPRDLDAAYRLVFNGGWTHSATGALPNGVNGYADTYLNPFNHLTNNNYHLSHYSRTQQTNTNAVDIAAINGSVAMIGLDQYYAGVPAKAVLLGDYNTNVIVVNNTNTKGLIIGSRTTQTIGKMYFNGVQLGNTLTVSNNNLLPDNTLYISANHSGNSAIEYSGKETAFASIGDGLSDTEAANFYKAVQTFQSTLGRQVGVPIVADTDAQAFLNTAVITDSTQASAVNTLVTSLKTAGIWTKLKAIYPFVGGTAEQHRWNLKTLTDFKLTFVGGWSHSNNGALPNGTTAYADTQLPPSLVLSVNNTHTSIYVNNNPVSYTSYPSFGCMDVAYNTKTFYTSLSGSNNYYSFIGDEKGSLTYGVAYNNTDSKGFYIASRTSSTMLKGYKNNLLKATTTIQNTGTLPTPTYFYGGVNNGTVGLLSLTYNNYSHAFASIGDGLTDAEATELYRAVEAFQTTLGRNVNTPIVADTDAQTFLNAAEITSQTQASAINTLVTDLKSAGIWTKMKAIYPFVGGTATSHKFNLKDPRDLDAAYRLTFTGGWTHTSTGALSNGSNSYADTKLVPSSILSLNNTHISSYIRDFSPSYAGVLLGTNKTSRLWIAPSFSSLYGIFQINNVNVTFNSRSSNGGLWLGSRRTSTNEMVFNNGSLHLNITANSTTLDDGKIYIAARNDGAIAANYFIGTTAFASIGDGLTDAEALAFYNAVQAFQTSLGRQV